MKFKVFAIFLIIQFVNLGQVYCDFYTSVAGLEYLLDSEVYLLENYENYLQRVKVTKQKIVDFLDHVEHNIEIIHEDPTSYFEHPFNAFKVLKRCVIDWQRIENFVFFNLDGEEYARNVSKMVQLDYANATRDDLLGASKGMARLQSTYALKAADIAEGILQDYQYESILSAHDCFVLGRSLYDAQQNLYAAEWLLEARMLLNAELEEVGGYPAEDRMSYNFPFLSDIDILEYLGPSMYNIGNFKMARIFNEELLALQPTNQYANTNKQLFETQVQEARHIMLETNQQPTTLKKKPKVEALYEAVCRGEVKQTPRQQKNLRCRYVTKDVPFCKLAPFKMEELSHDPFVAFYYDAIYENEMFQIMETTEGAVERSKVGDLAHSTYSDVRTSKNTWLYYDQHKFLQPIHQRLRDITGLSLDYAEPLQVANYGIGGHYGPHYDFSEDPDKTYPGKGNRILTALFYINDVELGGATAFPFLKLAVPPIRGGLIVWFNMHESLELDYRTRHAGCPVLKGSKWICNEWFHQLGQEFNRPCSLERNGHISWDFKNKY